MSRSEKSKNDPFAEARDALARSDAEAARALVVRIANKAKGDGVAQALVGAWLENRRLLTLQETGQALATELDLDRLLNAILDAAIDVVGAERGYLVLADAKRVLSIRTARHISQDELAEAERQISNSITAQVFTSSEAVLTTNAEHDDRFEASQSIQEYQLRSILAVPLSAQGATLGVLYMDNRSVKGMFDAEHLNLLELFAGQASVALENARLHSELKIKHIELEEKSQIVLELNKRLAERVERQQVELVQVRQVLTESHRELGLKYNYERIIGSSKPMQDIFRLLDRTTDTAVPVLVVGESGTGKELVAKAIHFNGPRKEKPFAAENVSAISESLLESELFGHVRGSFTGATSDKMGLFELADGGTLFLDEIGDMSKSLQSKLLRALQEGEIRRVGGKETISVDVRIISATHRNLEEMIESGDFRQDLYWRLNVIKVELPPLRQRREDIPLLIDHFLEQMAARDQAETRSVSEAARRLMTAYDWPGNVRELENEISRAVVLTDGEISPEGLSERIQRVSPGGEPMASDYDRPLKAVVEELERKIIIKKLGEANGNKSATAKQLGLSRDGLRKKLMRYGLDSGE